MHPIRWSALLAGLLLASSAASPLTSRAQQVSSVTVDVIGLRDDRGTLRCALFRRPHGFPMMFQHADARVVGTGGRCVFEGVARGRYAIAVHHDLDGDGWVDRTSYGFPREGIGCSSDVTGMLGSGSFASASFGVDGATVERTVRIRYVM